jgi:GNAT superfamily N-acetyltransferase
MLALRRATAADVPVILQLIRDLATYEREPGAVVATEEDLLRDGFGDRPAFFVDLADDVDEAGRAETIGFAFWFFSYSTWVGRRCLYLEDLFVKPEHRGKGAGLALMRALAAEAIAAGCRRFVWQVLDWNEPSIRFYESLGGRVLTEWKTVRIEGEALDELARTARPQRRRHPPAAGGGLRGS